ncbi:hypothetical protein EX895_001075 [Sporisorium graminicola]|uniref:Uncharacterized protein n=1 Tax=Sporisorium graminicola TaxID=280036 RepID=A0A4U7L1V7_9BASI|nr:hypothetical protein EX895_001075 [Sporisorium graminicola]TKY89778.1 hypothetical protein EX895_001075 [Sporisorium graminicola]
MSSHTTNTGDAQPWWSPSELLDLLSTMTPDSTALPPVASSSKFPVSHAESSMQAVAPSDSSSQHTPAADSDSLSQHWHPCTEGETIGSCLEALEFPVSYRDLVYRWEEAGSPTLLSLRVPLGVRLQLSAADKANSNSSLDLHTITEMQERAVIAALEDCLRSGSLAAQSQVFVNFASYLDIYASVHAELLALHEAWNLEQQASAYQSTWRSLLAAFDRDRSKCSVRESHDCLHQLLWGQVSAWPLAEIKRCFKAYKMRSPSTKSRSAISMPASPLFGRHRRGASAQAWQAGVDTPQTPYLSSNSSSSSSCGSSGASFRALGLSPAVDESASTLGSPPVTYPASTSYDAVSPRAMLQNTKQWPESSTLLQALQSMPAELDAFTGSHQAIKRRHSRSSSYPTPPMQLSQLYSGLTTSQSEGMLDAAALGSPPSRNAFALDTQYTRSLQGVQDQDQWQVEPTAMWMQHHQLLLQEAAVQLDMAAQLLSAKASRLRSCSAQQDQWHSPQGDGFSRPSMRRHHTTDSTLQ